MENVLIGGTERLDADTSLGGAGWVPVATVSTGERSSRVRRSDGHCLKFGLVVIELNHIMNYHDKQLDQ